MPVSRAAPRSFALRLPPETLKIVAIAFAAGVLCFVLVWLVARKHSAAVVAPVQAVAQPGDQLDPLPEPLPAGAGASDMPDAKPAEPEALDETPTLVETTPAPPPAPTTVAPAPATPDNAAPAATLAPGDTPLPIQGQMPPPRYPPAALRRGDSGSLVVRVDVDASGNPGGVTLVQRSGSRELDRAAMEAVRDWHFRPAQRDGQPVAGSIDVPFDFKPGQ